MSPAEQEFFKRIEEAREFEVREGGSVWRLRSWRGGGRYGRLHPIRPKQIGYRGRRDYVRVSFGPRAQTFRCFAHRLVWIAFMGDIPYDMEVNHINGVHYDNRIENLEAISHQKNCEHAYRTGLSSTRGETHHNALLTERDVLLLRRLRNMKATAEQAAYIFEVSPDQVRNIWAGRAWKHVPEGAECPF